MGNYIKIDRKILDWEWWPDINTHRLFMLMLLKANWKDGSFKGIEVPRGSFVSSIAKLAELSNLTIDEVRTALKHLKRTNEITSKSHSKFTVFTVNNYNAYQDNPEQLTNQIPSSSHSIPILLPTIEEYKEGKQESIYKQIIDLYNDICVSFPKVSKLSDNRKKAIKARLTMYDINDFKRLFELAEQSNFLKGGNDRNWSANFDWMIKDSNMAKVLDGNYNNSEKSKRPKNAKKFPEREYDSEKLAEQLRQANIRKFKKLMEEDKNEHK